MSLPSSPNRQPNKQVVTGPPPQRLSFVTVPLMIGLVYNAISLLTIPFSGTTINDLLADYGKASGQPIPPLSPEMIQTTLWLAFFLTALLILWLYFTRRAVLEGKSAGRVSSIVIAVLSLLFFPFGTVLGVIMLIGIFDEQVTAYLSR
ncbi:hypothetical protein [Deinococcus radiodurans]|jgi:hypothetical protein|uniref:Uncharacterized protein n=1 Tax=Deinococcus radiodurans (strain ATCC 13939 / DSM 20539 / JCM 16871 / CCUG 27074 / LMG 4051 / NBRC 15346 / NCIMB 9279 / VKM B-1422 / R1) TaxID=243230 RepID=Q9RXK4_DEIRA|nr:hypothetical protein [Deinococcus radiodurans]AAF09907.1 hypothetical protein DR_0308 [Deinococcus radiodurans R1 = ATCC 13939 = DSM 20539]ANC72434.1 hypothetical protein A2G07_11995 [Deinococcus radiodurans R1 = ATCC 13939 = DSM 20539]QEM72270.1 hypothetical protein DXG80_11190 [Deinococcus radiodurans]UDK99503.1 hypothetical protein E5E91_01595 [Deinococcus radiodurans R1 = ATCC 13939 = DSM 20539]UID69313.1 hypothetical protein DRO_0305 [Deinococcus radiodurans R1 = ATCC 13939 = DSM 20539